MRILLSLDGSPSSNAALEEVCRRPWPPGSQLYVITVLSPIEFMILREGWSFPENNDEEGWVAVNGLKLAEEELKRRAPDLCITAALLEGRPKDVILDEAERLGAELIILGSHGYSSIRHLPLGSVAIAVLLGASCSVEIVRPTLLEDIRKSDRGSP